MKFFLPFLSAVCISLAYAQNSADSLRDRRDPKHDSVVRQASYEDQKQIISGYERSWNYPGTLEEKQTQLKNHLQKYFSKDVVLRWKRLGRQGCKLTESQQKQKGNVPAGCKCTLDGNCRCDGLSAFITLVSRDLRSMPDARLSHVLMAGSGNRLVVQNEVSGTHLGSWLEHDQCQPTGNRLQWTSATVYTFKDGKVSEVETIMDYGGLMDQVKPKRESERRIGAAITNQNHIFNNQDLSVIDKNFADKVEMRCPFSKAHNGILSKAQIKSAFKSFFAMFPDINCQVEGAFATPTEAVIRSRCTGTNKGRLWDGSAPTGRRVSYEMVHYAEFDPKTHKVTKHSALVDTDDLYRKLQGKPVMAME